MKNLAIAIILTGIISFVATENYMLSNMKITGTTGDYTVTVFGAEFTYE